ncbi:hypothetical protein BC938DRAFT_476577 [Jimgerdemannia flammicorona]|uniref:Uncharacterized protein n=1 Tax=Jimgerdemannia flammicorona TaxID=994334 RepID=A0A433QQC5_9FUNG|nr:hypothetical protein BC938DRAFT_476577 [Jimgerdemannia flammicorona]
MMILVWGVLEHYDLLHLHKMAGGATYTRVYRFMDPQVSPLRGWVGKWDGEEGAFKKWAVIQGVLKFLDI